MFDTKNTPDLDSNKGKERLSNILKISNLKKVKK